LGVPQFGQNAIVAILEGGPSLQKRGHSTHVIESEKLRARAHAGPELPRRPVA
jgi:hypothetical protein